VKAIIPYGAQYKISFQGGVPTLQKQLTQTTVRAYNIVADSDKKLTEKQKTVFDFIGEKTALEENILSECCVTKAVLDTMVKNGVLNIVNIDKEFDVYSAEKCENLEINLSPQQTDAFTELVKMLQTNKPHACLLHGVTSSGKTLVFVKLLEEVLKKGKRAIVLVPEIGLTPQMVKRLKNAFGKKVAVVHSALGNTERLLQWQQIQQCEADIVVGTRSAVFAPVENLGLIIIDEEQEHTYRSEQAPRFLAHDVAKMRVTENNALLLLASATPSVESYYYANTGKYSLLEMSERYGNLPLPEVEIVDMRENLLLGNVGFLSARLREEICNNLNNDEQTILLLNRRGYQTVAICKNCAEVIKCENCSVPMVYHKAQNKLLCHHCGATTSPAPNICPKCGGEMKYTGYGTQKVEEELQG
ncbi:MAG: primosomal protein N', partial [Oscillospiraceae bacterium]